MTEYTQFALSMLGVKKLPADLARMLEGVDALVKLAKGRHAALRSSQVTAVVVAIWLSKQKPARKRIAKKGTTR